MILSWQQQSVAPIFICGGIGICAMLLGLLFTNTILLSFTLYEVYEYDIHTYVYQSYTIFVVVVRVTLSMSACMCNFHSNTIIHMYTYIISYYANQICMLVCKNRNLSNVS